MQKPCYYHNKKLLTESSLRENNNTKPAAPSWLWILMKCNEKAQHIKHFFFGSKLCCWSVFTRYSSVYNVNNLLLKLNRTLVSMLHLLDEIKSANDIKFQSRAQFVVIKAEQISMESFRGRRLRRLINAICVICRPQKEKRGEA